MEYEYKECTYDMSNRVYDANGIAPTITGTNADVRIVVMG